MGQQVDVQIIGAGAGSELTPERVALRRHRRLRPRRPDRAYRLDLGAVDELAGLRVWLHMLGFRGHFATKS